LHLRTPKVHRDIDVVSDTRAMPVDTFEQAETSQLVEGAQAGASGGSALAGTARDAKSARSDVVR
jgi:hypothetical protein